MNLSAQRGGRGEVGRPWRRGCEELSETEQGAAGARSALPPPSLHPNPLPRADDTVPSDLCSVTDKRKFTDAAALEMTRAAGIGRRRRMRRRRRRMHPIRSRGGIWFEEEDCVQRFDLWVDVHFSAFGFGHFYRQGTFDCLVYLHPSAAQMKCNATKKKKKTIS